METKTIAARHHALPQHLSATELPEWIKFNHVEKFTDERKRFFTEDEKNDFEHESALSGREIKRLSDMKKIISALMLKGNDEEQTFVIPATLGTKVLERNRNQNYDLIEKGYETDTVDIYAIPDGGNEKMEFFTVDGEHIPERSRDLSPREKHLYVGLLKGSFPTSADNFSRTNEGDIANEDTGELIIDRKIAANE